MLRPAVKSTEAFWSPNVYMFHRNEGMGTELEEKRGEEWKSWHEGTKKWWDRRAKMIGFDNGRGDRWEAGEERQ